MTYIADQIIIDNLTKNSITIDLFPGTYYLYIKGSGNATKDEYVNTNRTWTKTDKQYVGWSGTFTISLQTKGFFYSATNTSENSYFDILIKPTITQDFTQLEKALSTVTNADLEDIADQQGEYSNITSPALYYISQYLHLTITETQELLREYKQSNGIFYRQILAMRDEFDYFTDTEGKPTTTPEKRNVSKNYVSTSFYNTYHASYIPLSPDAPTNIPTDTGLIKLIYKNE